MSTAPTDVAVPTTPELPALDPGITLLESDRDGPTVHALAVDTALLSGGSALWIDPGHRATTEPIADLAPSPRVLDRIRVARGFTAYQHSALVERLPDLAGEDTAVVVVPEIDRRYREEDLRGDEGEAMLVRSLAVLARLVRVHDVPVLVTRARDDGFAAPVANAATERLRCEHTRVGPRFVGDDVETLVYDVDGEYVQTTLAFWRRVLSAREPLYDATPVEVTAGGAN